MGQLDDFRTSIVARQEEAEAALVRGDVSPRLQMWTRDEPVSLFGAVGVSTHGWQQLEPTFHRVASRLSGGHDVSYELMTYDVMGDMAWTAGFVRLTGSIDGGPPTRYKLRITHIYRREADGWKVVHEHSDFQPPDDEQAAG